MIKNFLSEEQSNMIDYLIEGKNISDIARILNKARTTIYKWLELDQVKAEIETRKTEIKSQAKSKIAAKVGGCLENIIEIANTSKDVRTKLAANKYICDQFLGVPGTAKEEKEDIDTKKENPNMNDLLAELEEIKNMKA